MKLPKKTPRPAASQISAFDNLDAHLANLNSYSVVYVEADGSKEVIKSTPDRQSDNEDFQVNLRVANGN